MMFVDDVTRLFLFTSTIQLSAFGIIILRDRARHRLLDFSTNSQRVLSYHPDLSDIYILEYPWSAGSQAANWITDTRHNIVSVGETAL